MDDALPYDNGSGSSCNGGGGNGGGGGGNGGDGNDCGSYCSRPPSGALPMPGPNTNYCGGGIIIYLAGAPLCPAHD